MNRFVLPVVGLVVVGTAIGAGSTIPVPPVERPTVVPADQARVTVVCPSGKAPTFASVVAAAALGDGLTTAALATPQAVTPATGTATVRDSAQPIRVSAPRAATFGAVSAMTASDGAERGLSLVACEPAAGEAWITGVSSSDDAQAQLVLVNLDNTEAAVDVTVLGTDGRIAAPGSRGIVVAPNARRSVALGPIANSPSPVTLRVVTSAGRVAAVVRQRLWRDNTAIGSDWIAPAAAPARTVVVPGLPAGKGRRDLVVVNPGERTASVAIDIVGTNGTTQIPGLESVDVPAGSTRVVQLERGLLESAAALRLRSEQKVTAAAILGTSGGNASVDFAAAPAAQPLGTESIWPVPVTKDAQAVLQLVNPGDTDATARVTLGSAAAQDVTVPAGRLVLVPIPAAETPLVRIGTSARDLHAAVTATQELGKVKALGVFALRATQAQQGFPDVTYDPHAGS